MAKAKNQQQIGLYISTSLVVGIMIGSGIFLMPVQLAKIGSISLLGWIFSGLGALSLAYVFSRLSKLVTKTGGPYAYPREGFGEYIGFLSGWAYWISIIVSNAAIAMVFTGYFMVFVPAWTDSKMATILVPLITVWLLTWVNSRGVKSGGKIQLVTTILKLTPLVAVSIAALFYFDSENLVPFNATGASNLAAIGASIPLTLFALLGFESATIPAGNIKNPKVTIPKATMIGTAIVILVYIFGSIAIIGVLPRADLIQSTAPFADAAYVIWGNTGKIIVGLGAMISTFGALNGLILVQAQMPFAMAEDVLLPPIFAKKSGRDVPIYGLLISSFLITAIILINNTKGLVEIFVVLILMATFFNLISYLFSSLSEAIIHIRNNSDESRKQVLRSFLIGLPAFGFSVIAIYTAGVNAVYYGFVLLILGTPFYIWSKIKQSQK